MMMMMPRWWSQTSAAHRCQLNQCFPSRGLFRCQVKRNCTSSIITSQGQIVRIFHNGCLWRFHPSCHSLQQDLKSHYLLGFGPNSICLVSMFSNHNEQSANQVKFSRTGLRVCKDSTSDRWGGWRWRSTIARFLLSLFWYQFNVLMVTGMKIDLLLTFARDGKCFQCSWWWFCCGRGNWAGDSW